VATGRFDVRFAPNNGHHAPAIRCPKSADTVAKVENREAPKISRMSNLGDLSRGKAL
jgi:hypothetical protein